MLILTILSLDDFWMYPLPIQGPLILRSWKDFTVDFPLSREYRTHDEMFFAVCRYRTAEISRLFYEGE